MWTRVLIGLELDEGAVVRMLDADTWQKRRQQFQGLGGLPIP